MKNKSKFLIIGIVLVLIVTLFSVSYGLLRVTSEIGKHKVVAGTFNIDFKDGETISMENTAPMSDIEGMKTKSYDVEITNIGDVDATYTLRLENDNEIPLKDRLNSNQVKYSIKVGEDNWTDPKLLSSLPGQILVEGKELKATENNKVICSIRLWVDENVGNEGQNKTYKAKLVLEAIQGNMDRTKLEDETIPTITLKGNLVEYIPQGEEYNDPGVNTIEDDQDELLKDNIEKTIEYYNGQDTSIVDEINTDNVGVYYITYKIKDKNNNEGAIVRTVNVYKKDTTPPIITLKGDNEKTLYTDENYTEEGASATDNDKDISNRIVITGTVNTKMPGIYTIRYIVQDDEGNIVSTTRTVTVVGTIYNRVTIIKGDGVESVQEEVSCEAIKEGDSCEVELPEITPLKGYGEAYFTENQDDTEGTSPKTKIQIDGNKTYYAKAKDIEVPVCKLVSVEPESGEIEPSGTVKIVVDCTDNSGSITTDLQDNNIEVTTDAKADTATKVVDAGTVIDNGKKYTITLSNFNGAGTLAVTIAAGSIKDASNNGNDSTPLTTGIIIKKAGINGVPTNDSGVTWSNGDHDSMFEFTHEATDQMEENTDYRYIGNTEKNYVNLLGTEEGKTDANLWRIIGVFEEENASGVKEKRIKLMLDKKLNNTNYSWDNNSIAGSNNWNRPSALKTALNDVFWNSTSGTCPYGTNSTTTACDFTSYKMSSVQDKIENMKWHLGAIGSSYSSYSTDQWYKGERGSTAAADGGGTTATGYVGLIYPSDYGYTYANGVDDKCYNTPASCNSSTPSSGWMFTADNWWTLTPMSTDSSYVFSIKSGATVYHPGTNDPNGVGVNKYGVRPALYLKSNIGITGGKGTKDEPYTVG